MLNYNDYFSDSKKVKIAERGSDVAQVMLLYKQYRGEDIKKLNATDMRVINAYFIDDDAFMFGFESTMDSIINKSDCVSCAHCPYNCVEYDY